MKSLVLISLIFPVCQAASVNPSLFQVGEGTRRAFLWTSIGLAVLTAFLQGLVTALAFMTESANYWTFRFRLAKIEHWWWTIVSAMLLASLVLITLSFLSGNSSDAVSILALSTATFLTIVQYMLPSWRARRFIHNRWLAWTGNSRTSIPAEKAGFCGAKRQWIRLIREVHLTDTKPTPSDWYGWRLWPAKGFAEDPTDILRNASPDHSKMLEIEAEDRAEFLYSTGEQNPRKVSLLWGEQQGFRRRVSRATSSMPSGLLQSRPFTIDGYAGEGLCLAMGILGRNKGLEPKKLVFNATKDITTSLEDSGTWAPRPYKVLRSYYEKALQEQYGGLKEHYIAAATELALLLVDIPPKAIAAWLEAGMEHQSIKWNREIASRPSNNRQAELKAHYESSYVSMIISLNYMDKRMQTRSVGARLTSRPDIVCTGLLLKAWGEPEPEWWNNSNLADVRRNQINALEGDEWKDNMAGLLGLGQWPAGFENTPSIWDNEKE